MVNVNDKSSRFFALYTQIQGRLYSYLMMAVHNQNAADDLLQEISAIMWKNFDSFEPGTNFDAWAKFYIRRHLESYKSRLKRFLYLSPLLLLNMPNGFFFRRHISIVFLLEFY